MTDPPSAPARRIELERVRNFRDVGGYETSEGARVRWRTVFRSSTLSEATPADVQRLLDLDLALVLDLRTNAELERTGVSPLHEHGVEHRHVPYGRVTMRDPTGPGLDYLQGVEDAVAAIGKVFAAIAEADESRTVAFNCEGGKDRTGVTSALLLRLLGVPDETIVEDYALTREYLTMWRDLSDEQIAERGKTWGTDLTREMLDAAPETMQSLLSGIDARFGSTEALLALGGVDERLIARLHERLLER